MGAGAEYGLGRRHAPDDRDRGFLLRAAIPAPPPGVVRRSWWAYHTRLDQGATPTCVGHAWAHFLADSPYLHDVSEAQALAIYDGAQHNDEWFGEDYDGTSVRGGAKFLQGEKRIGTYYWAFSLADVVRCLLAQGPVIVGTNWYEGMFDTVNVDRYPFVEIGGDVVGGHAYKLDGVDTERKLVRMKNSWGTGWGRNGFARMSFDTLEQLLDEDGEACMAVEVRP